MPATSGGGTSRRPPPPPVPRSRRPPGRPGLPPPPSGPPPSRPPGPGRPGRDRARPDRPLAVEPGLQHDGGGGLVHHRPLAPGRPPRPPQGPAGGHRREPLVVELDRDRKDAPQGRRLLLGGQGSRSPRAVQRQREPHHHHLTPQLLHLAGDHSVVVGLLPAALEHSGRHGQCPVPVAHRHPDTALAQVEAHSPHCRVAAPPPEGGTSPGGPCRPSGPPSPARPSAARTCSRASSMRPTWRPPAMATSGSRPPPPPTVREASARSSDATRPLPLLTAATSATPCPSGEPMRTAPRMPGRSRTPRARSRIWSRGRPSRRATTTSPPASATRASASWRRAWARKALASSVAARAWADSRSIRSGTSSTVAALTSSAARPSSSSSWRRWASEGAPVRASIRLVLAPIDPSETIRNGPMAPRVSTWVPPHSSTEECPACTTRTHSPYLSPKKAMAPTRSASARSISSVTTGGLPITEALTRSSTLSSSARVTGPKWLKSKRS